MKLTTYESSVAVNLYDWATTTLVACPQVSVSVIAYSSCQMKHKLSQAE